MKKFIYRLSVFMLALVMAFLVGCSSTPEKSTSANVADIAKHGNLILDITGADLFDEGYQYGDILKVSVNNQTFEVPLCSNYSDVDNGAAVLRATSSTDPVVLAINMGDFATAAGIATKVNIEEEPGYRWDYLINSPVKVKITLKKAGAYRDQWIVRQLVGSAERTDYAHLTDEQFANFRMIDTTGVGSGILYRSSSPINPSVGRNTYADAAAKRVGIVTVINLANTSNTYEGTEDFYYESCQVTYLGLGADFLGANGLASLARGMRAIIDGDGPYLIHCDQGKDRAGFVSALLECLMGASIQEVIDDYMETYYNYYGVEAGSEKYNAVVRSTIVPLLNIAFKTSDAYKANLALEAEAFLKEDLGLTADEVVKLKAKLGKSYTPDYSKSENWAYYAEGEDKAADVFLICPTVDMGEHGYYNMSMNDEEIKSSFVGALNMERGIYEDSAILYSPYYRQMTFPAYSLSDSERAAYIDVAYRDVAAAFEYYFENCNNGRPLILAGFSQGSEMLLMLMEEYFDDPKYSDKLVAAYCIGWRITEEDIKKYPHLKMAEGECDTGVIVSFNSEAEGVDESIVVPKGVKTLGINPLNWKTDSTPADKSLNEGACFTRYSGEIKREIPELTGAYLDESRGTLRVTDIDPADYKNSLFPDGVYHLYDYQFFYRNLQKNVAARLENYIHAPGK